jgi:hypothetical protein
MDEKQVGVIDHFFDKISVAMIRLSDAVKVGDKITVKTKAGAFTQDVTSMQIDRVPAEAGKPGDVISVKVPQKVHKGETVHLVG